MLETVKIKVDNHLGYVIINKTDFDESVHELYVEKSAEPVQAAPVSGRKPKNEKVTADA